MALIGNIKPLIDKDGNYVFPETSADAVYFPDGTTVSDKLEGTVFFDEDIDTIEIEKADGVKRLDNLESNVGVITSQLDTIVTINVSNYETVEKAYNELKKLGGGTLFFPDGEYIIPRLEFDYTSFTKSVNIKGNGRERTKLKFLDDVNNCALYFHYVSCEITDLTIEGLKTANDYSDYQAYLSHHAIQVADSIGYTIIKNCNIKKFRANGISIIGASNILVENNNISECYGECILTSINGKNSKILNNICDGAKWGIDSNVIDTLIDGNVITNCENAITFENMNHDESEEAANFFNTKNAIITNNFIDSCLNGINSSTANFKYKVDNVIISNNNINLKGNSEIHGMGITLDKVTNVKVKDNIIKNCYSTTGYPESANAIFIQDGANIEIDNNIIDGVGRFGIALKDQNVISETDSRYKIDNIYLTNNKIRNVLSCGIGARNRINNLYIKDNEFINCVYPISTNENIPKLLIEQNYYHNCTHENMILNNGCINQSWNDIGYTSNWRTHSSGISKISSHNGLVTLTMLCQTSSDGISERIICNLSDKYKPSVDLFVSVSYFKYDDQTVNDVVKIGADGNVQLLNSINGVGMLGFTVSYFEK